MQINENHFSYQFQGNLTRAKNALEKLHKLSESLEVLRENLLEQITTEIKEQIDHYLKEDPVEAITEMIEQKAKSGGKFSCDIEAYPELLLERFRVISNEYDNIEKIATHLQKYVKSLKEKAPAEETAVPIIGA